MTDTTNRNRVSRGVPQGGEFATGARLENDDLPLPVGITKEQRDEHQLRQQGATEVRALPGIDPQWFEDNRGISAKLNAAGVTGTMTVFSYSPEPIGEWSGVVAMPDGDFLAFTAHRGSQIIIETRTHPSDGPYQSGANGMEGEDGGDFGATVERVLFEHEMLSQLRRDIPFADFTCLGGRNGGSSRLRVRGMASIGQEREIVDFKMVGEAPYGYWAPAKGAVNGEDGFAAERWEKAARLTHVSQEELTSKLSAATSLARASSNVQWNIEARERITGRNI